MEAYRKGSSGGKKVEEEVKKYKSHCRVLYRRLAYM